MPGDTCNLPQYVGLLLPSPPACPHNKWSFGTSEEAEIEACLDMTWANSSNCWLIEANLALIFELILSSIALNSFYISFSFSLEELLEPLSELNKECLFTLPPLFYSKDFLCLIYSSMLVSSQVLHSEHLLFKSYFPSLHEKQTECWFICRCLSASCSLDMSDGSWHQKW